MLVNSNNDDGIEDITNQYAYPPLSIISLGSALVDVFGESVEVSLFDAQVDSTSDIQEQISKIKPDLFGVSVYLTSVRNSVNLVKEAKECGAITIMGNDQAIFHAENFMKHVPELDYVCLNDVGEETLTALVAAICQNEDPAQVPGLMYRSGEYVMRSKAVSRVLNGMTFDAVGIPNRTLLDERYWREYKRRFHTQNRIFKRFNGSERVSTINRARGCAQKANPCRYCGIADLSVRYSSGDIFWKDVRAAKEQVGATVLYEAFDSASSAAPILRRWLESRPDDLEDTYFKMYAQAFESNQAKVDLFKELNVFCINMGLDNGDDEVLKLLKGARHSLEQNKKACLLYTEREIEIYTSFVLVGLGSERRTAESLDKTVKFAEWLVNNTSCVSFDAAMMYPDRGAPIGRLIWHPDEAGTVCRDTGWDFLDFDELERVSKKWRDEIYIDANELCADFAKICGTSDTQLRACWDELKNVSDRAGMNFGGTDG